jgi:hypothetical protein
VSEADWPARYEVRIDGLLDARWSAWLWGLRVETEGHQTVLSGTVRDQAALRGLLDMVCDLGLSVVEMRRLPRREEEDQP